MNIKISSTISYNKALLRQAEDSSLELNIDQYLRIFPDEGVSLSPFLNQLGKTLNIYDRKSLPGHITSSGFVVDGENMLLVFHPFLKKWLQPGGHIEQGETPLQAAIREVLEETGVRVIADSWHKINKIPIDINIHRIPKNLEKQERGHWHYDFRYLFHIEKKLAPPVKNEHQIRWSSLSDIEEENLTRLIKKTKSLNLF